jgi:5-methylcytosine-specific restriction protein A
MSFSHNLKPGDTISNEQLTHLFKCGIQGGMRRSHKTNTLVLVSDHTKKIYEDRWVDNTLHYSGIGMAGDQSLDFAQNKTLAQLPLNGVAAYLFEVFEEGVYIFRGRVELAGEPYQDEQPDKLFKERKVWVFPLKAFQDEEMPIIPESVILKKQEQKEKEAKKLSDEELARRAKFFKKGVGKRQGSTTIYEKNPYVAELAKRRANGICQLCKKNAPFNDRGGNPYLDTHHIIWLSKGGPDTIVNTVAICPNCHRKMHTLNIESDRKKLKASAMQLRLNLR